MAKRQAYEVIAEIESKWKQRCGCMIWSWSSYHIAWLMERWKFKNPGDVDRWSYFIRKINQRIQDRVGIISVNWLYFYSDEIREMMVGAGLNVSEPIRKPVEPHDRVIVIPARRIQISEQSQ